MMQPHGATLDFFCSSQYEIVLSLKDNKLGRIFVVVEVTYSRGDGLRLKIYYFISYIYILHWTKGSALCFLWSLRLH
jgi:hypothetical protein